jgi:CHAD domain-containing protein
MKSEKNPWVSEKTAAENARLVLPALAESFFEAGRSVAEGRTTAQDLHQFRLRVKKLRYHLELFGPCYGPGLQQRIDVLKRIQDNLGRLNDCEISKIMLREATPQRSPAKQQLREFLTKQAAEEKAEFVRYWKEACDAPGQFQWWTDYLKRFAGTRFPGR